jgi:ketosteroid isomerase-like protein
MATQIKGTRQVLDHHLHSLAAGNIDEILDDYHEDALLIIPDATFKGHAGIRSMFEGSLQGLFKPGTYHLTMDTLRVEGDVAYIVWHAKCSSADVPYGTDTFIVRDGKIAVQTFAAKIDPR